MINSPDMISIGQWEAFKAYLIIDEKISTSPSSMMATKSRFLGLCKGLQGKLFTRDNLSLFLYSKKEQGAMPSTLNNSIKIAKQFARYVKNKEFESLTYFKEQRIIYEILTTEEIKAIAELEVNYLRHKEMLNRRAKALFYLLSTTGMRISEVLNLTWQDVFEEYLIVRESKNGEQRIVPFMPFVSKLIFALPKHPTVFNIKDDWFISFDLKKRAELTGCKKRVWNHLFRHTFITTMLENGVDPLILAKIVGHKDVNSTQKYDQRNTSSMILALQSHPLMRQNQTLEQLSLTIKRFLEKLIDKNRFSLEMTGERDILDIAVKYA